VPCDPEAFVKPVTLESLKTDPTHPATVALCVKNLSECPITRLVISKERGVQGPSLTYEKKAVGFPVLGVKLSPD